MSKTIHQNLDTAFSALLALQNDETAVNARDGSWQDWHDSHLADAADALLAIRGQIPGDTSPPEVDHA